MFFLFALLLPGLAFASIPINNNTYVDYICDYHNTTRYSTGIDFNHILFFARLETL